MALFSIQLLNFRRICFIWSLLLLSFSPSNSMADQIIHSHNEPIKNNDYTYIPFAIYTEELDTGIGMGFGWSGAQKGQASLYAAGLYTTNNSYGLFLRGSKFQINSRLFLNATYVNGRYKVQRIYVRNNPDFPTEQGGTNDSSEGNFLAGPGRDTLFEPELYYILPIGDGHKNIIKTYMLTDGILSSPPSGGQTWNPLITGRSYIHFTPFYRSQKFNTATEKLRFNTNGIKLSFQYDNRDFPENPSTGSNQKFRVLSDFGWGDSSDSWTVIDFQYSKYFSLGESLFARQRVIALDFWTANTPTWQQIQQGASTVIRHRPPPYMGATLGGVNRLRSYPSERFNDKAAIYYSAEYRFTPRANPLGRISLLHWSKIDWWQFVGFIEMGRVAPQWQLKTLHKEMQQTLGFGLRAMALRSTVRLDVAFSDETWQIYAMVGHPF